MNPTNRLRLAVGALLLAAPLGAAACGDDDPKPAGSVTPTTQAMTDSSMKDGSSMTDSSMKDDSMKDGSSMTDGG